jgi:hypothetical protein
VSACNGEDPSFDGTSSDPDGGWHEVLWVKHGPPTRESLMPPPCGR